MNATSMIVRVTPIVLIEEVEQCLDAKLRSRTTLRRINKMLKKARCFEPREVTITALPGKVKLLQPHQRMTIATAIEEFWRSEIEPAPLPYLLGCVKEAPQLVSRELRSIVSIETFFPLAFSFPFGVLKKPTFLCVRHGDDGTIKIDTSEYLSNGAVNGTERVSGNAVRTIVFAPQIVSGKDMNEQMIG